MIKISALFALVAACNAVTIPQYFINQQPLTFAHHQPAFQLAHAGPSFGIPVQFASAPKPATVVAVAAPAPAPVIVKAAPAPAPEPFDPHPQYSYAYKVTDALTGDDKEASETRDGDSVSGKYSLVEPDGSVRTVTYTADNENGFQATVQREAPKAPVALAVQPAPVIAKPVALPAPAPIKQLAIAPAAPAVQYVTLQHAAPAYQQYHPLQVQAIHHAPIQSLVQPHPQYQYVLSH